MEDILISWLNSVLRFSVPILLASLGQVFTQRSGVLNLGVEGIMLMGALFGLMGASFIGNPWVGVILGMVIGLLIGLFMSLLTVTLGLHQAICGLGIFYIGLGLSNALYQFVAPLTIDIPGKIEIPLLSLIPVVGPTLFHQDMLVYLALILVLLSSFVLFRTTLGLKIRAVGEDPRVADNLGINVNHIRYLCIVIGGALAGLGGAYMSVVHLGWFREGMTVGRGWIAIGIVYFGKWIPYRCLIGSLVFGSSFALQLLLQAFGVLIPYEILLMTPYLFVILALLMMGRGTRGPASMGRSFRREEE